MTIEIGVCLDEKNKLTKTFNSLYSLTGYIKEPSSVIDPVILIEEDLSFITGCNYIYIPAFRRYYYIRNMKSATNTTCTIESHVDVLKSFQSDILACSGYVDRNEDICSVMIPDPERLKQSNPVVSTVPFTPPASASDYTYCLITTQSISP